MPLTRSDRVRVRDRAAFMSLGMIAAAGLALYATAMPETGPKGARKGGLAQADGLPQMGEADR
jgi:hypothetical protein